MAWADILLIPSRHTFVRSIDIRLIVSPSRLKFYRSVSHFADKDPDQPQAPGDEDHYAITEKLPKTITSFSNDYVHITSFFRLGLMEGEIIGRALSEEFALLS